MLATELGVVRLARVDRVLDVTLERARPAEAPADPRAEFAALAREHGPLLQSVARRLCGSSADARDLVQDTHERAFRRFGDFEQGSNARAWLLTILHRAFIDRCRRTAVRRADCIDDVQVAVEEPVEPPAWASVSGEQLAHAIASLEDEFQSVYRLHAIESLSYQAIAERLGIPVNTVGTRLSRARRKLRSLLDAAVREEGP